MIGAEPPESRKRLLVVDDEVDVAATICMMAAAAGYESRYTHDPESFFEDVFSWEPTHVIVDLQLADSDGIDVIHRLAEMGFTPPVIIISGLGGRILDSAARFASESGLALLGTLSKPLKRSTLLSLLAWGDREQPAVRQAAESQPALAATPDALSRGLEARAFIAHFQPKISCADGELTGFECLARWPQPDGSLIPPDIFIALAERNGLIHELTRQIFDYALSNLPRPDQRNEAHLKMALNLSAINLTDESFPSWLLKKCTKYGVSPSSIILEVTETASMDNPLALLEQLTQFRIRGFHLSIDDFGVGFSSLVQLARLPFSELKIDQIFVKTLASSDESRKIVTAVVGLGKSLGLNVVAEGVEDEWALNFLHEIGCDEAQGYFISRPIERRSASKWNGVSWRPVT